MVRGVYSCPCVLFRAVCNASFSPLMVQDSISSSPFEIAYHFTTLDPVKIGKPLKTFEKGSNEVLAVASLRDVFKSELKENRVGGCKWISPLRPLDPRLKCPFLQCSSLCRWLSFTCEGCRPTSGPTRRD
jgi:hypothetical protein